MNPRGPWLSLFLLAAIATGIGVMGTKLSMRTETIHVERERDALHRFENELQKEMERLSALFERHLVQVAQQTEPRDPRAVRESCGWLVGLKQFSLIHSAELRHADFHAPVDARLGERLPEPIFADVNETGLPRPRIKLSAATILRGTENRGWEAESGGHLLFWFRSDSSRAVVLLLDADAIHKSVSRWLMEWARGPFEPLRIAGGPEALLAPNHQAVLTTGSATGRPNLLLPLRTAFGTWHIASWDRVETRTGYHLPTLLGAVAASLLVAVLGVLTFFQQRSALRLAAQRVSFVNSVSHELRTPLTNMLLNLDLVVEHTSAMGTQRLELVREEAARLGRLIENVLTFSRAEHGKLAVRGGACQPDAVLERVVEQFSAALARRGITIRTNFAPGNCVLDADALAQIASNLLSNVEKYAAGCEVVLNMTMDSGSLRLRIEDGGPGIPWHAAEKVFRPFERLDSRISEGATGTGLGLAIARELADSMGGTLRLLPSEIGAVFELETPIGQVHAPRLDAAS